MAARFGAALLSDGWSETVCAMEMKSVGFLHAFVSKVADEMALLDAFDSFWYAHCSTLYASTIHVQCCVICLILPSSPDHLRWRHTKRLLVLFLTMLCASRLKHLVEVVLAPPNIWIQACEFPHAVDFLVPVGVVAVRMTLDQHFRARAIGVLLMWDP